MAQPTIQSSFNSGEWAPNLFARVDLAKYHSGAALLENFFVDYRGGASTRTGTEYILQAYKSSTAVRLISFQASSAVGYMLEFGDEYIRFFNNGAPVLQTAFNITAANNSAAMRLTIPGHNYAFRDWIYVTGVGGMTQINNRYFIVLAVSGNDVFIGNLRFVPVNSTTFGTYTAGGTAARVYTIPSPYGDSDDLRLIKFAQNINQLILCHPNFEPYVLTLISAANWTLIPITIGATISAPTGVGTATTLAGGAVNYSYIVTAVDTNGQESTASAPGAISGVTDLRNTLGTNTISWSAVPGAVSYNVYKAELAYAAIPSGASYGFIGNCTGLSFNDSNIAPDYASTFPIGTNPFLGAGVEALTLTATGTYTAVPTVSLTAAPAGGITATAAAVLQVQGTPALVLCSGAGWASGDAFSVGNGVVIVIETIDAGTGLVLTFYPISAPGCNPGAITSGNTPANPITITSPSSGQTCTVNLTWGVGVLNLVTPGAGYLVAPSVTFNPVGATATASLAPSSDGYPSVPGFFQQRLVLANQEQAQQTFHMSVPGAPFNFNVSNIAQPNDAISAELSSGQLNTIRALVPTASGLLIFTDRAAWLINGGSAGSAVTPFAIVSNAQSFIGVSDVPPIVANFDVLYVQAKGSIIRDSAFNFYNNVFTGTDISIISSHLFYGYQILEWAWAEEPFKLVWAIRNDGTLLSLTFQKEQDFIGWAHHVTDGEFKSVATVTENVDLGQVDATYVVVERDINGFTAQYIERIAEREFPNGLIDSKCVDSFLLYDGAPATTFSGGDHLAGKTVTGLYDGEIIPPFVMPNNGIWTTAAPVSKVIVGLAFTAKLQTLSIDTGDPTIQGKVKKIPSVTVRVSETLALKIGSTFDTLVAMKDLVLGNVSSTLTGQQSQVVTDLVTGDAQTILDPRYTVPGQYCLEQSDPYPATVLGVFPELLVGDTGRRNE